MKEEILTSTENALISCRMLSRLFVKNDLASFKNTLLEHNQKLAQLISQLELAVQDKKAPSHLSQVLLSSIKELKANLFEQSDVGQNLSKSIQERLSAQKSILKRLKKDIASRWTNPLKVKILGIGEITTTIELIGDGAPFRQVGNNRWAHLAVKKAPSFPDKASAEKYAQLCYEYEDFLTNTLGITTPYAQHKLMPAKDGRWLVYNLQERLSRESIACLIIQVANQKQIEAIFTRLLAELKKVFLWNLMHPEYQIGFDAQIPNWAFPEFQLEKDIKEGEPLLYIDTSTPLIRRNGEEQLDAEVFIKSVPALLRPIIRHTLLKEVIDRYYRPRDVVLDLLASFITHHRPDLVPRMVELANQWIENELGEINIAPFNQKEIFSYNYQDVLIWKFFRQMKRMDRFITEKIFKKTYEQRLPKGSPKNWENLVGAGGKGLTLPEQWQSISAQRNKRT